MILWTFINLLIEALVCLMEVFINLNKDFPFNTIRINFQTSDKTPITVIHNLFFAACNPSLPTLISVLVIRKPTQRDLTLGITARIPTRSLVQPGFIFSALEILLQFCLSLCRSPLVLSWRQLLDRGRVRPLQPAHGLTYITFSSPRLDTGPLPRPVPCPPPLLFLRPLAPSMLFPRPSACPVHANNT